MMEERKTKEIVNSISEMSKRREELVKTSELIEVNAKPLKKMIGNAPGETNGNSSKLIAAGIALIAFPDPTVSDILGTSLIAAGVIKNRMKEPTVADVYQEIQKTAKNLRKMERELLLGGKF